MVIRTGGISRRLSKVTYTFCSKVTRRPWRTPGEIHMEPERPVGIQEHNI